MDNSLAKSPDLSYSLQHYDKPQCINDINQMNLFLPQRKSLTKVKYNFKDFKKLGIKNESYSSLRKPIKLMPLSPCNYARNNKFSFNKRSKQEEPNESINLNTNTNEDKIKHKLKTNQNHKYYKNHIGRNNYNEVKTSEQIWENASKSFKCDIKVQMSHIRFKLKKKYHHIHDNLYKAKCAIFDRKFDDNNSYITHKYEPPTNLLNLSYETLDMKCNEILAGIRNRANRIKDTIFDNKKKMIVVTQFLPIYSYV